MKRQLGDLLTREIVESLKKQFPLKNPSPDQSISQIMYEAGQQRMLTFLYESYAEAEARRMAPQKNEQRPSWELGNRVPD